MNAQTLFARNRAVDRSLQSALVPSFYRHLERKPDTQDPGSYVEYKGVIPEESREAYGFWEAQSIIKQAQETFTKPAINCAAEQPNWSTIHREDHNRNSVT